MAIYSQCKNIEVDGSDLLKFSANLPEFIRQELREQAPKYEQAVIAMLEKIRSTWSGWSVLAAISRLSSKKMAIRPWKKFDETFAFEQNATAGPTDFAAANSNGKMLLACADDRKTRGYNETGNPIRGANGEVYRGTGRGSDTEVRFTPEMWTGAGSAPTGPGAEASEILLHEMVHGLRQMRGVMSCGATTDNPGYDTREEFMAILTSNLYRSELRRPGLRADHRGFAKLPVPLEDPLAFLNSGSTRDYIHQFVEEDRAFAMHLKNVNCAFNPIKLFYDRYPTLFAGAG